MLERGGATIEIELRKVSLLTFGQIVAEVPAPLAIGSVEAVYGRWVKGFVRQPSGLAGAEDITGHGGWRNFLAAAS